VAVRPGIWFRENARAYFGNAAATRDYRAQLRGNRALWLWGGYLAMLVLITGIIYFNTVMGGEAQDIAYIQFRLREFYTSVMTMLAIFVTLVTPAMTASSITIERQRKSLDLVFTAPVAPKYLLVGKMLSSYRYTWMLLMLALPITAVSVVMGGATWMDVLAGFIMLSAHALVFTAIGILLSTLSPNTVAAVVYTYLVVGVYSGLVTALAASFALPTYAGGGEMSWAASLTPFAVAYVAPAHTTLFGVAVPNWVFTVLFALLVSKLLLVAAASALTHHLTADTRSLRIHGLVYAFVITMLMVAGIAPLASRGAFNNTAEADFLRTIIPTVLCLFMTFLIPHLSCYSRHEGAKFRRDGFLSFRQAIIGKPSGALAYILMFILAAFGGGLAGAEITRARISHNMYLSAALYCLGFLALWWGVGRLVSALQDSLKTSRLLVLATMVLVLGAPIPVLSIYTAVNYDRMNSGLWKLLLLYPTGGPVPMASAWVYGLVTLAIALVLGLAGERYAARRAER
jgi:hypothetical protein